MKTVRLLILTVDEVRDKIAEFGAEVPEGLAADQLANLYAEHLEKLPDDVDVLGLYVGANRMNIIANDDEVWSLPDTESPA